MTMLMCAKAKVKRKGEVESFTVRCALWAFDRLCQPQCVE